MKAAAVRTVVRVNFGRERPQRPTQARTGRVPRVARLLALAHKIDEKVRTGEYHNLADAARQLGLTRARVSQITNLLLLAPAIQEAILGFPVVTGRDPVTERKVRPIAAEPEWNKQMEMWRKIDVRNALLQDEDGKSLLRAHHARVGETARSVGGGSGKVGSGATAKP